MFGRYLGWMFLLLGALPACTVFKSRSERMASEINHEVARSKVFSKSFTGFVLLDPATGKTLADHNGAHYFTPASNAKILALATCLELLGDSIPGMKYFVQDSFLVFRGVGDPSFLHPAFQAWRNTYNLLADPKYVPLHAIQPALEPRFGPGWAWDDYSEDFQPEKSEFPVFGNTMRIVGLENGRFEVQPSFFRTSAQFPYYDFDYTNMIPAGREIARREGDNLVGMKRLPRPGEEFWIPFRPPYWEGMLADTLHRREIDPAHYHLEIPDTQEWKIWYNTPTDTILRRMMQQSDNFIAEQLLLVCAETKFGRMKQDTILRWALDSLLADLPQKPRWVDGSGLSRYNLITPQSIAQVLFRLWNTQPHERILSLFPAGGKSGTIAEWYKGKDGKPFVFAKTGGMSGVHCLSGYLICKSGKVLTFSFMHNNFLGSNREWKREMQRILEEIRDRF